MNMRNTLLVLVLAAALALPLSAQAMGRDDMNVCLCKQVLARTLCKEPVDFNYVGKIGDATYLLNVFYGSKESRFYCTMTERNIVINGKTKRQLVRTIPYEYDASTLSATVNYSVPECPVGRKIYCRSSKTLMDKRRDEEDKFWNRPVPEILEDELKFGIASERNATEEDFTISPEPEETPQQQ